MMEIGLVRRNENEDYENEKEKEEKRRIGLDRTYCFVGIGNWEEEKGAGRCGEEPPPRG